MKKEYENRNHYSNSLRFMLVFFMLFVVNQASAIDYYIDSVAGSDLANGTTISTPWKNVFKINTLTLVAGNKVYLKCGSVWNAQQLKFGGSGTAASPIIIDKYGTGDKPRINGNGLVGEAVVYLYNQDYIEINNLEITNFPTLLLYANSTAYTLNQIVYNGIYAYQVTVAGTTPASGGAPIHTSGTAVSGTVTFTYYCKLTNLPYPDNMFFTGVTDHPSETNPRSDNPLGADRRGVMVAIKDDGVANHIYLKNLNIHHIKGQLGNGQLTVNGAVPKRTAGIYFAVLDELSTSNSRFNDVLIDGCDINYVENTGLAFDNEDDVFYPGGQNSNNPEDVTEYNKWYARRFSNIKVSNNVIHHIGKNAMIIRCTDETGLIERNVCYETAVGTTGNTMFSARAKGTVFQYNEGYFNRSTTQKVDPGNIDGSMYDPDYGSVGVIFQYSYSHDNSEGIYWGCNTRGQANNTSGIPDPEDVGCTLRYCISQNDMGDLIFFNYPSAGNEIYNNVFYIKPGLSSKIIHESGTKNHTYNFYNNIIFDEGNAVYAWGSGTGIQTRDFKNNVFYGIPVESQIIDNQIITSDPLFVDPGKGTIGINALLDGYKLKSNSPALSNGKIINPNGGSDFYGNLLSTTTAPNRGFYEGVGIANSSSTVSTTFTTSGTWTAPAGVTSIQVEAWGGGGGGGGSTGSTGRAGGGGGGGAYVKYTTISVTAGTPYTLTVGAGGTASTSSSSSSAATAGGTTTATFNGTAITAVGGNGGVQSSSTLPGTGATAITTGNSASATVSFYGGAGSSGAQGTRSGGGGGAAGEISNGGSASASAVTGGLYGGANASSFGKGADGNNTTTGNAGNLPGGGGGGGYTSSTTGRSGGAGGAGRMIITYTPTAPSITLSANSLTGFSTSTNSVSTPQTINLSALNLTADVTINASTNFEISTSLSTGFGTTLTIPFGSGTVSTTPIYVRVKSDATAGLLSEAVTFSSDLATSQSLTCSGAVVTNYYYKGSGSLPEVANWGTNLNGFGINPPDFVSNYQMFVVANASTVTIDVPLTFANLEMPSSAVLLSADITVNNNLTVGLSGALTLSTGKNLTVKNALINNATAGSAAVVIESGANLIQGSTTTVNANTGNITVKRNSNGLFRLDYAMWSSPVSGTQALGAIPTDFSPLTTAGRFYTYNSGTTRYNAVAPATLFTTGTGYLIRMPNEDPSNPGGGSGYALGTAPLTFLGAFTGVPNNGTINVATVANTYNGVGNPYPSVIDAELFKASNSDINTLYFWRKTNNLNQGASPTTSYATYNIATATGVGVAPDGAAIAQPTITPDKFIQVGQGFLFSTAQSSVVFNNAMRVANNGNKILKTKIVERNSIWLNLSNSSWPINQMALCYMDGATQGVDDTDSKYFNDSQTALTSLINNEEYVIQGRPAFDPSDVVPLAFKTTASGDYTIALDHFDGVFATGQDVYLVDSKTGAETDLKASSYTFTATAGLDNARFSLKYQKTLKVDVPAFNENSVSVYKKKGTLYVNSRAVAISNIKVFDIQGRLIAEQKNVKSSTAIIKDLISIHQVLIVKILGEDRNIITKKIAN